MRFSFIASIGCFARFVAFVLAPGVCALAASTVSTTSTLSTASTLKAAAPPDSLHLKFTEDYRAGAYDADHQWMGGTETMRLLAYQGRLFASMGYWTDKPGADPQPGAQILRKDSAAGPWRVEISFGERYQRVDSLTPTTFTTDFKGAPLQPPACILLAGLWDAGKTAEGRAVVWLRDGASGKWEKSARAPLGIGVRSFASHVDKVTKIHHLFAGTWGKGVFRGAYDPTAQGRLKWDSAPELTSTGRVMAFAECNGDLYAACGIKDDSPLSGGLFRRVDGPNPRWELAYRWPYLLKEKQDETTLMRGLTVIPDPTGGGYDVMLGTRAYPGIVARIDPKKNSAETIELDIKAYFAKAWGMAAYRGPALSAYNNITPFIHPFTGEKVHLIGVWVEHPDMMNPPNNGSYYLVRRANGSYEHGNVYDPDHPVPAGQRLRATRTIEVSPFPEDKGRVLYFGGYDCAFNDSHNTAWIYKAVPIPVGQ